MTLSKTSPFLYLKPSRRSAGLRALESLARERAEPEVGDGIVRVELRLLIVPEGEERRGLGEGVGHVFVGDARVVR